MLLAKLLFVNGGDTRNLTVLSAAVCMAAQLAQETCASFFWAFVSPKLLARTIDISCVGKHKISSVASLRRERILVQSRPAAESTLRFYRRRGN